MILKDTIHFPHQLKKSYKIASVDTFITKVHFIIIITSKWQDLFSKKLNSKNNNVQNFFFFALADFFALKAEYQFYCYALGFE